MPIDPKLVELLGLDKGPLGQREKGDKAWAERLMAEVVEPFDQILKDHREVFERIAADGIGQKLVEETNRFNDSVGYSMSMMLVLLVVSHVPITLDPEGELSKLTIKVLSMKNGVQAVIMYDRARALGPIQRKEEK